LFLFLVSKPFRGGRTTPKGLEVVSTTPYGWSGGSRATTKAFGGDPATLKSQTFFFVFVFGSFWYRFPLQHHAVVLNYRMEAGSLG
jgi:hypothetical protein